MCKKILYVEDDNLIRDKFSALMDKFFDIESAENGKIGLQKFLADDDIELIITDISMPIMDGLEMIENIRNTNDKIAIYITSAFNDPSTMDRAFELNTNRFIEKPVKINEIMEFISNDFKVPIKLKL